LDLCFDVKNSAIHLCRIEQLEVNCMINYFLNNFKMIDFVSMLFSFEKSVCIHKK
jgi:hypothetical protein